MNAEARPLRIDLAYDGTAFAGWQRQPGLRTVQGELERVLARLQGDRPARVHGAGRTDAGVHARGQVANCRLATAAGDAAIAYALRRLLPPDLRALAVATVTDGFDARRSARSKTYRYRLDLGRAGDPFVRHYALHYVHEVDRGAVREALALLPGRRDWSGFTGAGCEIPDRVRHLTEARWDEAGTEASFTFSADGFLYHMVRNLVGTLLDIGRGRFEPARITTILASGDRRLAGPTAPPHGLCLERVDYGGETAREV